MTDPSILHPPFRPDPSVGQAVYNSRRSTPLPPVTTCIVLLLVQLWLLVGAVEEALGGEGAVMFPATLASGLCFWAVWRLWPKLWHRL